MHEHTEDPAPARFGLVDALSMPVYDLGAEHVFAPGRQRALFDLLDRMELVEEDQRLKAGPATQAGCGGGCNAATTSSYDLSSSHAFPCVLRSFR